MKDYRLADLLDLTIIQKMADAHYRAAGMPIGILDAIDGSILVGSGWQDICVNFHRANQLSLERCRESDNYIKDRLVQGEACKYKCKNGLWDIGIPIVVTGRHLATLFLGQFFYADEAPDQEFFTRQAHEFDFHVDDYVAALDRVPTFSREKVDYILEYDKALVDFIAALAEHALLKIKTDEKIRENERKFHAVFDQAYQFIGLLSLDGRMLEANRTALAVARIEEADVIGRPFWETPWWAHSSELQEKIRLAVQEAAKGELVRFEATHLAPDGNFHYVDFSLKPVKDEAGRVIMLMPEGRDITERLSLESQLHQAQKMESVGRLAGGVAHDFNNMLGVIIGHAELSLDQMDPTQPLFTPLQEILEAAVRSADLTRQLLAFARKQTVAPKTLDLNEAVEGMFKMLRRLIGEDIDLVWLPDLGLCPVKMDPSQIDQILANLCVNARDAIEGVGKVTIETHTMTFDEAYCANHLGFIPGDFIMLAVSDDGRGMDKDTLDNIFEPFFTTKAIGKGTGLGLATVYGIVKQNNGFINVYSEPGHGSTFKIYLSRHTAKTEEMHKVSPAALGAQGDETILLVEDEVAILKIARLMLENLGYRVLVASTPGEAITIVREYVGKINLLLTDVVMPEMNGRDLAKKLSSHYPGLKSLFMSGYTSNAIAHHSVLDDGINFIEKPFSRQALAAKVREVLDSK